MSEDRVAAYLARIRERQRESLARRSLGPYAGDAPRLLKAVEDVLALADKAEHGATRWEDPLPVPEWVPRIREAISAALLGEAAIEAREASHD